MRSLDKKILPSLSILTVLVIAAITGASSQATDNDDDEDGSSWRAAGTVVRVLDGDTLNTRIAGKVERVRLIGIEAPEGRLNPDADSECGGVRATRVLRNFVLGDRVILTGDKKTSCQRPRGPTSSLCSGTRR